MEYQKEKIKGAILYMQIRASFLEHSSKTEVCSSIRYEQKMKADGYKLAIADLKSCLNKIDGALF